MVRAAALILAIATAPAVAQTTTCQTNFGLTTCNTIPRPGSYGQNPPQPANPIGDFTQQYIEQQRQAAEEQQRIAAEQRATMPERNAAYLRKRVGEYVAGGDCEGGEKMAVANGDFALAAQVKEYCASRR